MYISPVNNVYQQNNVNFQAGKIKVRNPQQWKDVELRAFANNPEFKKIANGLKAKGEDLFAEVREEITRGGRSLAKNRVLQLSSGKNEAKIESLMTVEGTKETPYSPNTVLQVGIMSYPNKITELSFPKSDGDLRNKTKEDLARKNIYCKDVATAEMLAVQSNKEFVKLADEAKEKGEVLHISRCYGSEFYSQGNSVAFFAYHTPIFFGFEKDYKGGYFYDEILRFTKPEREAYSDCKLTPKQTEELFTNASPDIVKQKALDEIEEFNKTQDCIVSKVASMPQKIKFKSKSLFQKVENVFKKD